MNTTVTPGSALSAFTQDLQSPVQLPVVMPAGSELPDKPEEWDDATRQAVAKARSELNLRDTNSVVEFGSGAQSGLAQVSARMIDGVRNKDIEPASDALNKVILEIRGFSQSMQSLDGKKPGWPARIANLFKSGVSPIILAMQRYETVEAQINVIVGDLDRHVSVLMTDVAGLDRMYDSTLQSFRALKIYIRAGEDMLTELENEAIPALKAALNSDPLSSQRLSDAQSAKQRLERRVHDLKLTRQVLMQSLPTTRLIQDNDANLLQKIRGTVVNTIPLWQQQIALLMTAKHGEKAALAVRNANDITNELLVNTANALRTSNKAIRVEVERGIFDVEAVKLANQQVIGAITDALDIYRDGAKKRREGEAILDSCESNLRKAMEGTRTSR